MQVKYFAVMREISGKRMETIEIKGSIRLVDLLRLLAARYGREMDSYVFDQCTGALRPILQYMVDGETHTASEAYSTMVKEESVVSIMPTQGG